MRGPGVREQPPQQVALSSRQRLDQTGSPGSLGGPGQVCEGVDPMGRGRAKAKQTKVARDLKYRTHETDFGALAKELHGESTATDTEPRSSRDEHDEWSDYADPAVATDRTPRSGDVPTRRHAGRRRLACPATGGHAPVRREPVLSGQPSQMPRSRPTSRIRRSASRSAAIGGRDAVGVGQLEDPRGGVEDRRRRAAWRARRRSPRARRRPGSGRRRSRSSRARRGCRAPRAASRCPGGRAGCWRRRRRSARVSASTTSSVSAPPSAQGA